MKTLMKIFVILSTVLCVSGFALASNYTFESEINPKEFQSWTVIEKHQTGPGQGTAVLENPDPNAKIKKVAVEILGSGLLAYSYIIDGKTYKYRFNFETGNFDKVE